MRTETSVIVPIPKYPYFRIGPLKWQDWHRQVQRTVTLARDLKSRGIGVEVVLLTNFRPAGKQSEIEIYAQAFQDLAPELTIRLVRETTDTVGQVERSLEIGRHANAHVIFVTAWMQYLRVVYLSHGREARHCGVFGIPQLAYAVIDPFCLIFQPVTDILGLGTFFRNIVIRQREKGRLLV